MAPNRPNRYSILGYVVWHGAKWYLRRRISAQRRLALKGAGVLAALAAAAVLAKRLNG